MNISTKGYLIILMTACLAASNLIAGESINFYGRVLDNNDEPVEGANVTALLASGLSDTGPAQVVVQTDSDGFFVITGIDDGMEILFIGKEGYFFFKEHQNQMVFPYKAANHTEGFFPNENDPVEFRMDKLESPQKIQTFLTFRFRPSENNIYEIDLTDSGTPKLKTGVIPAELLQIPKIRKKLENKIRPSHIAMASREPNLIMDISISVDFIDELNGILILEAMTPQAGLTESETLLIEAPEEGYLPKLEIQIPLHKRFSPLEKYLFIRSQNGNVVSQVILSLLPSPQELIAHVSIKSNLNGSLCFQAFQISGMMNKDEWKQQQERTQNALRKRQIRQQY